MSETTRPVNLQDYLARLRRDEFYGTVTLHYRAGSVERLVVEQSVLVDYNQQPSANGGQMRTEKPTYDRTQR